MLSFEDDIKNCLKVLHQGGIILYPTDTLWRLGCDATNETVGAKNICFKKKERKKG